GKLDAIDGDGLGPVAFRLEAEPSIPRADIEHTLAMEIGRDWIACIALFLHRQRHVSVDDGAVRKLEAVIPAFGGQVLAEIESARGFPYCFGGVFGHLTSHSLTCGIGSACERRSAWARASLSETPPGNRARRSACAPRVYARWSTEGRPAAPSAPS